MKRTILVIVSIVVVWELIIILFSIPNYFLPPPYSVAISIYNNFGLLIHQTIPTLEEILLGLFFGVFFGIAAAMTMIMFRPIRYWMGPVLVLSQAIPIFVFAPLIVIWLGYGISSKVVITLLSLFFPVTSYFFDGLTRTNQDWIDLAHTMNSDNLHTVYYIRIPAALPSLASGIKVAAAWAPMAALVGEWVGASKGLGYLMIQANSSMDLNLMFGALIFLIIISLAIYYAINYALDKLIPWQKEV